MGLLVNGSFAIIFLITTYVSWHLFDTHRSIHGHNACGMTFMFRSPQLMLIHENQTTNYRLYQYMEYNFGLKNKKKADEEQARDRTINEKDIPVLFVHGSGGSAFQVRSMASVMMNKTGSHGKDWKMHFYAVDFKEELGVLSGKTLIRQRDYVLECVNIIRRIFSNKQKIIFVGHSFGGVILRNILSLPEFNNEVSDLTISFSAPLKKSPLIMDQPMLDFYNETEYNWNSKSNMLADKAFVSFSGGLRDFQVPDHLSNVNGVHHVPSWSVSDPKVPSVDHLCVLWCNQLVRYSTRILQKYAENVHSKTPESTKEVVERFLGTKGIKVESIDAARQHAQLEGIHVRETLESKDIIHDGVMKNDKEVHLIKFHPRHVLSASVTFSPDCSKGSSASIHFNENVVHELDKSGNSSFSHLIEARNFLMVVLSSAKGCSYSLEVVRNHYATLYTIAIEEVNSILIITICVCMVLVAAETVGDDYLEELKRYLYPIIIVVMLCGSQLVLTRHAVIYSMFMIIAMLVPTLLFVVQCVQYLLKSLLINRLFGFLFISFTTIISTCLYFMDSTLLAYFVFCSSITLNTKSTPKALLALISAAIFGAISLSSVNRDLILNKTFTDKVNVSIEEPMLSRFTIPIFGLLSFSSLVFNDVKQYLSISITILLLSEYVLAYQSTFQMLNPSLEFTALLATKFLIS